MYASGCTKNILRVHFPKLDLTKNCIIHRCSITLDLWEERNASENPTYKLPKWAYRGYPN